MDVGPAAPSAPLPGSLGEPAAKSNTVRNVAIGAAALVAAGFLFSAFSDDGKGRKKS